MRSRKCVTGAATTGTHIFHRDLQIGFHSQIAGDLILTWINYSLLPCNGAAEHISPHGTGIVKIPFFFPGEFTLLLFMLMFILENGGHIE